MIGDILGDQLTTYKVDRAVLAHTRLTTEVENYPYPLPPEPPPPAPKQGWGSLGQARASAAKEAAPHRHNKRKIFGPSKKAIPKQVGQTSILSFYKNTEEKPAEE